MHGTMEGLKLLKPAKASRKTVVGNIQCDQHNRDKNERASELAQAAHERLVLRFSSFIQLQDQNLEPVKLMETVADRLWIAAQRERQRRIKVCPEGFEHLVDGA